MSAPLTKKTTDHSGAESFSFSFFCDICGKEWVSPAVLFETDGMTIEHQEARTLLWTKEHSAAFEQANLEAHLKFNHCSVCGKRVCDDCFKDNREVCRDCNEQRVKSRDQREISLYRFI